MKQISVKELPGGRRRVVMELEAREELLAVRDGAHYQLGDPLDDVVPSHILGAAKEVSWCAVEQKWVA